MSFKKAIAVITLLAGISAGWYGFSWLQPGIKLTEEEHKNVKHFTQKMTTRCIGRYLIDLPDTFTATQNSVMAFVEKSPIEYKRIYRPAFEQKIRLREAELRAEKTLRPADMPYLKGVYSLPDGMEGVIFERNESTQIVDASRILEAHFYTNGVAVKISLEADNGLSHRYDEDRKDFPEIYGNNVPQKIAELTDLLKRISARQESEIPVAPGFCLPELFIKDGIKPVNEDVNVHYLSSEYPHMKFYFDSDNYTASDDSLLERRSIMEPYIKQAQGSTIHSGRRHISGLYAEQWLAEGMLSDTRGQKALRFLLRINEKTASPLHPVLSVNFLQEGTEGEGRLTQAEAVTLWQQITDTIRVRPNAIRK